MTLYSLASKLASYCLHLNVLFAEGQEDDLPAATFYNPEAKQVSVIPQKTLHPGPDPKPAVVNGETHMDCIRLRFQVPTSPLDL